MQNRKRFLLFLSPLLFFLAVGIFLALGLGSDPSELESALVNKVVPRFVLQDIYDPNNQYDDNTLFRGRPLLLNVWATWCSTCRAEHAFLNQLAEQGVVIIGLNYKDDRERALNWLEKLGDPYQVGLYDVDGMLGLDLGVYGAPETYFIDSLGVIRYRHVGDINAQNWQQTLKTQYEQMH